MSGLERKVYHDCQKPDVADQMSEHRWVCSQCKSMWVWWAPFSMTTKERCGFLGMRIREVPGSQIGGGWHCTERTSHWERA